MSTPKRFSQVIELRKNYEDEYKKLHTDVWPGVLQGLAQAHIEDYSITFLPAPLYPTSDPSIAGLLIASFKYTGNDLSNDMKALAKDPETQRWWKLTDPMQNSLVDGATGSAQGDWWYNVPEVFRFER